MGLIAFISALAFLLVFWITQWSFFFLLAKICGVVVVVCMLIGLIIGVIK